MIRLRCQSRPAALRSIAFIVRGALLVLVIPGSWAADVSPSVSTTQLALNGYWNNVEKPGPALAIVKAAAGQTETPPAMAAILQKQLPWAAAEHAKAVAAIAAGTDL